MKTKETALFDITEEQIESLYDEIIVLSKKRPDGAINKFKLKFINELLTKANSLLGKSYLPFQDFTLFDEEMLPSASDVALILSQYLRIMDKFRFDHTKRVRMDWFWIIDGNNEGTKSKRPKYHFKL
jgi:hypothetical protein